MFNMEKRYRNKIIIIIIIITTIHRVNGGDVQSRWQYTGLMVEMFSQGNNPQG